MEWLQTVARTHASTTVCSRQEFATLSLTTTFESSCFRLELYIDHLVRTVVLLMSYVNYKSISSESDLILPDGCKTLIDARSQHNFFSMSMIPVSEKKVTSAYSCSTFISLTVTRMTQAVLVLLNSADVDQHRK